MPDAKISGPTPRTKEQNPGRLQAALLPDRPVRRDLTDSNGQTLPQKIVALVTAGALLGCTSESAPPVFHWDGGDPDVPALKRMDVPTREDVPTGDVPRPDRPPVEVDGGSASPDVPVAPPADVPPSAVPASFGPGFTDLTTPLDGSPPVFLGVPRTSMGEEPEPTVGLFGDLDGDGSTEVLFGATLDGPPGRTTVAYGYDAARGLTLRGPLGTMTGNDRLNLMAVLDLDDDGLPDLLFNRPEGEVAWGLGAGRFTAPTSITTHTAQWAPGYGSLLLDDVDSDGWLDATYGVSSCCATCRDMKILLRNGPRSFVDRTDLLDAAPSASSYALLSATLNGTRMLVSVGQPCGDQDSPTFYRWRPEDMDGFPHLAPFDPTPTDAYIRSTDGGGGSAMRSLSHWVPMGAALGDADGDGQVDLAISLNFYVGLFQNPGRFPLVDRTEQFGERPTLSDSNHRMIPWGIGLVDVDQDGRLDLCSAHGNDHSAATDPSYFVGPQFPTVHWNAGAMSFSDVTARVGVGHRGQWRSLAIDDLDRDGDPDLLVGSQGENPRVLRNDLARGNHGFSLRLHGTTSNVLGVGALVSVQVAAGMPEQVHVVGSIGSPLVFSAPRVFVGLGAATRAARVRVTWPSGLVQELRDVPAGTMHTVEEPAFITVTPSARHLPADGRATATVRVTPRRPDGTARTDARVEVALAHGSGRVAPGRWVGDAWEAVVTAPALAGFGVLEVRVDGVAAGVRPRLWWD